MGGPRVGRDQWNRKWNRWMERFYFFGTAVSQGNSGGPLLNDKGTFVGMNVNVVGQSALPWRQT